VVGWVGWRQDNGNWSNQESKFDFLATHQRQVKIYEGQQKIKIVRTNRQSNLRASCQSIFSLCRHHPIEWVPLNLNLICCLMAIWPGLSQSKPLLGWCREREKMDWQEALKFDCRLVRTIFIFLRGRKLIGRKPLILIVGWCGQFLFSVVPLSIFARHK